VRGDATNTKHLDHRKEDKSGVSMKKLTSPEKTRKDETQFRKKRVPSPEERGASLQTLVWGPQKGEKKLSDKKGSLGGAIPSTAGKRRTESKERRNPGSPLHEEGKTELTKGGEGSAKESGQCLRKSGTS